MGRKIEFIYPVKTASVSVTGAQCELGCAHCGGHYLAHMLSLPQAQTLATQRYDSILVSGGCRRDGWVPWQEHLPALMALKSRFNLNMHVGLIRDEQQARQLAAIADCVSYDFVGDDATIKEVYGLTATVEDYVAGYRLLRRYTRVIPHICLGLNGGILVGEERALDILAAEGVAALVFIVFTPTAETRYAHCAPPELTAIRRLWDKARAMFPGVPLKLGCMRPGGAYRQTLDMAAVTTGLDAVVLPAPSAVAYAREHGFTIVRKEECCVL